MQGIFGTENGPHTLWFLTLLFMCYLLVPILQKFKEFVGKRKNIYIVSVLIILGIQMLLAFYSTLTLDFGHPISWYVMAWLIFAFGYLSSESINKIGFSNKKFILAMLAILVSLGTRFITSIFIDGTLLYNNVICIYSNFIFNISLFIVIYYIYFKIKENSSSQTIKIVDNKIIKYFDGISYCFYVIHHFVLCEVLLLVENQYIFFIVSLVVTIILAHMLKWISDIIQKRVVKL